VRRTLRDLEEDRARESLERRRRAALAVLRTIPRGLYVILDAARRPAVYALTQKTSERCVSLYQGESALTLRAQAPYLIELRPGSALLERIVLEGWGDAWGVFVESAWSLEELRHQLRMLTFVELPDGKKAYFRFYDPRVLRAFLPTCDETQRRQLCAGIDRFLLEGSDHDLLQAGVGGELRGALR